MKKFAFSLSELLIVLAIIAIVAVFGFTIGKKGTANAYNKYFYNGYSSFLLALSDTSKNFNLSSTSNRNNFIKKLRETFSDNTNSSSNGKISTPNGIEYQLLCASESQCGYDVYIYEKSLNTGSDLHKNAAYIWSMKVPASNKKHSETTCLAYLPTYSGGILVPMTNENTNICNATINLQYRQDLLPFFVDNGLLGRVISKTYNDYGNIQIGPIKTKNYYKIMEYQNAHETFCHAYNNIKFTTDNNGYILNCSGISDRVKGVPSAANPQLVNLHK